MPQADSPGNSQRLTLAISGCIEDVNIFELSGQQTLSAPYELLARFSCSIPDLVLIELAKQAAIITLCYKNESRYFHGIIKEATFLGENGQFFIYEIQLVPRLWFLNYRNNCRIFQQKTVEQIITQLLQEAGLSEDDFKFVLKENYPVLKYSVQFNESDFSYLSRLLEYHGIHYHFVHQHNNHVLIFADNNEVLPYLDAPDIELRPRNGLEPDYTSLASFSSGARIGFDHARHIGFDLSRPAQELSHQQRIGASHFLEHYSFHEHLSYENADAGQLYIDQSLQAFSAQQRFAKSDSDIIRMEPGYRFNLINHMRRDFNQKYLVHNVTFKVRQYGILEQYAATDRGFHYDNQCHYIPASVTFKPPQLIPRPQLDYQDGVFVTGPEGEEIYTDKYGRIKVQFPWDREGQNNENSSCWLPVSQSWAGNQWGKIHIPRIGHEVLVSFINGDPDQPIVMASLYNAINQPPYPLPKHKTRSTTKSNSSLAGKGFNEIRFEDKKGQEQMAIFAEKDIDNRVKNNRREHIQNDRHLIVEQDRFEHIKNNKHVIIDNNQNIEVGQDYHLTVDQNHHSKVGKNLFIDAGNEIHIKAGNKLVFDAGEMLSMKAGGSVMKTSAGGIGFNGATIRINAGGSPGSGSGANAIAPQMPQEADKDYPGYIAKQRSALAAYKSLRLMEQETLPEPKAETFKIARPAPVPVAKKIQKQWLAILLVDDENHVVPDQPFQILQDDTIIKQGKLDKNGFAQYPEIISDDYRIIFSKNAQQKTGELLEPTFANSKPKTALLEVARTEAYSLAMKKVNQFKLKPSLFIHLEIDINAPKRRNDSFTLMTEDGSWNQSIYLHDLPETKDSWVELQFNDLPSNGTFHLIEDPNETDQEPFCVLAYHSLDELKQITKD